VNPDIQVGLERAMLDEYIEELRHLFI
jgi:hypothetical protein